MSDKINKESVSKALEFLQKSDMGHHILKSACGRNFDVREIIVSNWREEDKRGGWCGRQIFVDESNNEVSRKDIVLVSNAYEKDPNAIDLFEKSGASNCTEAFLANLLIHEFNHGKEYNGDTSLMGSMNFSQSDGKRIRSANSNAKTTDELVRGVAEESLMEADCRALQFMFAVTEQKEHPEVLRFLEMSHMPTENDNDSYMKGADYKKWKQGLLALDLSKDENRQEASREIFGMMLGHLTELYPKMYSNAGKEISVPDYGDYFTMISAIYDEKKYGKVEDFVKVIPNLSEEKQKLLVAEIQSKPKKINIQHSFNVVEVGFDTNHNSQIERLRGINQQENISNIQNSEVSTQQVFQKTKENNR